MKHIPTIRTASSLLLVSTLVISGTAFADSKDRSGKKLETPHTESNDRSGKKTEPAHTESNDRSGRKVEPAHTESNDRSGRKTEAPHTESNDRSERTSGKVPGAAIPATPTPVKPVKQEPPHTDSGHSSNPNEVRVRLYDAGGSVSGEAEYENKPTKTKFEGNVRVSLPNSYGIYDRTTAAAAQVTLTLTHAADVNPYAECTLALRSFKQSVRGVSSVSYRVASTNVGGTVSETPVGAACDDLSSGTPITAVPTVTTGDSVTLSINNATAATGFVQ